jgi:glycosyltransferase involved in cell wall biosynthesis
MRILQVCPRYYPEIGGIEEHVQNITERLARKHEVTVATTDPTGKLPRQELVNYVEINRFKSWAPSEAYYFSRKLKTYLAENCGGFDVVHAHNYHAFPALYAAQAKASNRLIFTPHYHGTGYTLFRKLLHFPYRYMGRQIFEKADRTVFVSDYERSLVLRNFRVEVDKTIMIPNGISLKDFGRFRKKQGGSRTVLYVGRLEKYKGVQHMIKALPRLDDDVVFEVVGKGHYKDSLTRLAVKLGVGQRVNFRQDLSKDELLQEYVNAELFVLLSKYEAYGITVAEALASGTPVIVTSDSGLSGWVDGKNCFGIEDPSDTEKLVHLVCTTIGKEVHDPKLVDWDTVAAELVELYQNSQVTNR